MENPWAQLGLFAVLTMVLMKAALALVRCIRRSCCKPCCAPGEQAGAAFKRDSSGVSLVIDHAVPQSPPVIPKLGLGPALGINRKWLSTDDIAFSLGAPADAAPVESVQLVHVNRTYLSTVDIDELAERDELACDVAAEGASRALEEGLTPVQAGAVGWICDHYILSGCGSEEAQAVAEAAIAALKRGASAPTVMARFAIDVGADESERPLKAGLSAKQSTGRPVDEQPGGKSDPLVQRELGGDAGDLVPGRTEHEQQAQQHGIERPGWVSPREGERATQPDERGIERPGWVSPRSRRSFIKDLEHKREQWRKLSALAEPSWLSKQARAPSGAIGREASGSHSTLKQRPSTSSLQRSASGLLQRNASGLLQRTLSRGRSSYSILLADENGQGAVGAPLPAVPPSPCTDGLSSRRSEYLEDSCRGDGLEEVSVCSSFDHRFSSRSEDSPNEPRPLLKSSFSSGLGR